MIKTEKGTRELPKQNFKRQRNGNTGRRNIETMSPPEEYLS